VPFSVVVPDIDESPLCQESPHEYVVRIAQQKAQAGLKLIEGKKALPVLASDTAVVIEQSILGKPKNPTDAKSMLRQLSGKTHQVMTAVCVATPDTVFSKLSVSDVSFAVLSEAQIDWYIETGEGEDKAGGYAVQGLAALFIEEIQGSYSGIMGLPIRETGQLLQQMDSIGE
jgi:septum formation protein